MSQEEQRLREKALRKAVLQGQEDAWQLLYDPSFASLYAYVQWRCGGLNDPTEEIVQETWLIAIRRIRSFDPDQGTFLGWLRGIAAQLLRNHFRKQARRNGTTSLDAVQPWNGATELEEQERAWQIAQALAALPDHYEAVLRARYLESQSVKEIAQSRNESPKAIESLLTRARAAFRTAYGEDTHE